jgi:hypothetical protein
MPTVFENLSDGFYTAFFEPDSKNRQKSIETWVKQASIVIQPFVEEDLRTYLKTILTKDLDTDNGHLTRAEKFTRIMDTYKLCLDVTIRQVNNKKDQIVEPLSPEVRARTMEAAKKALPDMQPIRKAFKLSSSGTSSYGEEDDYDDENGRSPNDDRSDSMNPNNDAYEASMDNRSDQMNPNNDAYWSSRGR